MSALINLYRKFRKGQQLKRFYQEFIQPGDLCFDIGANHGDRTRIFRDLGARVIALEPQSSCFGLLQQEYRNDSQVTLIQAAAGATEGVVNLRICDETDACATLSDNFVQVYGEISGLNWGRTEKVTIVTLSTLIARYGMPDFCKVDTEGYESEVFRGLNQPIPCISFEFNQGLLDDTAKALARLGQLADYRCNFLCYEHMKLVLDTWVPLEQFASHLRSYLKPEILTGEIIVRLEK